VVSVSGRTPLDPAAAFDQLGRLVLAEHSMESVLQKVADLAKAVVPAATEVSVSLLDRDRATTVVFTGDLAKSLDENQYEHGRGPCLAAATGGEPILIDDMATETRWGEFTAAAIAHGSHSSLSTPVPLQEHLCAALNIYGSQAHSFDDESQQLATTFASYAGVALANMHLYETTRLLSQNLETAMQSRAVIDQAKGILMAQQRCSADQAFDLLVRLSQRSNRKLRDVAQALVDSTTDPKASRR
jgi:GAF domain-containing protein